MCDLIFIIFILSAAAVDRQPAAGIICVCAAAVLMIMGRKMVPGKRRYKVTVLIVIRAEGGMGHAVSGTDQGEDIPQGGGFPEICKGKEVVQGEVRL